MDFASLMSAQISKEKTKNTSAGDSSKKYLKRSDVEAQRQAAYLAEQRAQEEARREKLEKKRKLEDEEAARNQEREDKRRRLAEESRIRREMEEEEAERKRRKRLGLPELPPKKRDGEEEETPLPEGEEDIPEEELVIKLRDLKEPAKLFGETHRQRLRRYWRLVGRDSAPTLTDGPIPTILQLVPEADMRINTKLPSDPEKRKFLFRQLASYFTMVLKEWEVAMAKRSDDVKASFQGKQAQQAMVHARENLRPFFKKMEKGDIEDGILEPVLEIVNAAQERRYVDANDAYLRVSIGKA